MCMKYSKIQDVLKTTAEGYARVILKQTRRRACIALVTVGVLPLA